MFRSLKLKSTIQWGVLLVEVITLVLGIALGFWVNEWRAGRAQQATAEAVLRSIARELTQNRMQAAQKVAYITDILAEIDSAAATTDLDTLRPQHLPGWRGAAPPLVRAGSFEAGLATGAFAYIDFETADTIVNAYAVQDIINGINEATLALFMSDTEALKVRNLRRNFQIYAELLPNLIQFYDRTAPVLAPYGYEALDGPKPGP